MFLLIFFGTSNLFAQEIIFGTNNYIEYRKGNLPIVISVPHGGNLEPSSIPDRTCNDPVYATDANTVELALAIEDRYSSITGCKPYIIICHLDRRKLDANRNQEDAACNNPAAVLAWQEFHGFIEDALQETSALFDGKRWYVDLHGHGNPINRIELGYLLYDDELALSDAILNTQTYINYSSIQNLVETNMLGMNHSSLLRGDLSYGTLLENEGYPTVPSASIPFPGVNSNYFSGGYNLARHSSYNLQSSANGVQMECNFEGIRDTPQNRQNFASSFVQATNTFFETHINTIPSNCVSQAAERSDSPELFVYPNPSSTFLVIDNLQPFDQLEVIDMTGRVLQKSLISRSSSMTLNVEDCASGIYFLRINKGKVMRFAVR